jgi:hypothetical protein
VSVVLDCHSYKLAKLPSHGFTLDCLELELSYYCRKFEASRMTFRTHLDRKVSCVYGSLPSCNAGTSIHVTITVVMMSTIYCTIVGPYGPCQ